jgi:hypothetical protein
MKNHINFAVCLKLALKNFAESKQEATEENLDNFVTELFNNVAFSSVITRNELIEHLVIKGIDREFVNKHLDILLKLEDLYFTLENVCVSSTRYVNDCVATMKTWYLQHTGERNRVYTEIKHDYFDEERECWVIDAWRTPDDEEEGVAPIEVYLDGSLKIRDENAFYTAIVDFGIAEALEEVLNEIQSENKG